MTVSRHRRILPGVLASNPRETDMLRSKPGDLIAVVVASAVAATSLAACGWHW
jgi:hypothetical protein